MNSSEDHDSTSPVTALQLRTWGSARLAAAASEGVTPQPKRQHEYPFAWGECWKHCVEVRVSDLAAEVGFFADLLGLPPFATGPGYMMFTSPDQACHYAVAAADATHPAAPSGSVRVQFMIKDLRATAAQLEERGVEFTKPCATYECDGVVYERMLKATCVTPSGIALDLWEMVAPASDG